MSSDLGCGFGHGFALGTRFSFEHMFLFPVCLWKALRMQECAIVLGSCSFRDNREKSLSLQGQPERAGSPEEESVCFSFVSPGVLTGQTTWSSMGTRGRIGRYC